MAFGRSFWGAVLFGAVVSATARAEEADLLRASLDWHAASNECLDPQSFQSEVDRHLGRAVFADPEHADVGLRVTIEPPLEKLHARVEMTIDGEVVGARDLEAPRGDCDALRQTAILVVAMLLDVPREDIDKQRAAIAASKAEKKPAAAKAEPPKTAPRAPQPAPRRAELWRVDVDAVFGVAAGVASAPALGGGVAATLTPPARWTLRLGIQGWTGATIARGSGDATFDASSLALGVGPRPITLGSVSRIRAWLAGEAGLLRGAATGYAVSDSSSRGYAAVALGVRPELDLGSALFLCLEAQARVLLVRPTFTYQAADGTVSTLHQAGPLGGDAELGLGWKIK